MYYCSNNVVMYDSQNFNIYDSVATTVINALDKDLNRSSVGRVS